MAGNEYLLEVVNLSGTLKPTQKGQVLPQLMEFQVNPELAPFLVSSTRSMLWVPKAGSAGQVRAAVRPRKGIQVEIVGAILEMSLQTDWGNVGPWTTAGIHQCRNHLAFYGFEQLEALVSPSTDLDGLDFKDIPLTSVSWLTKDTVVLVPIDRGFVGTLGVVGDQHAVALVHNASRGVGIVYR